ncbi:MAG: nitrous oxide reductase family maturation protein NosD [Kofleriaceae bacterium]
MRLDALVVIVVVATACSKANGMIDATAKGPTIGAPPACTYVAPGGSVQAALDDPQVSAVCLQPGRYEGSLRLAREVTLWGPRDAFVAGSGTIIDVTAPKAAVLGMTIDGKGGKFDRLDGAVRLTADDTRVEGVRVINATFGILIERASRVRVVNNHIFGSRDPASGLRGDTVRMWETRDSLIEGNTIEDGRDLVVWYSRNNSILNNYVLRARYAMHFMYSHDNIVRGNRMIGTVVGVFVMYSRGVKILDNLIADASGAAGMAIGIKDSGNIDVLDNRLIHDTVGVYVDSSPMQRGDRLQISRNVIRLNETGVAFHSSAKDLEVRDNDLADNTTQVRVDGGGDATAVTWSGNYFDDYAGYDLDDDGIGDVPYELRSLSNQLISTTPSLAFFRGTAALALVDAATKLDPLYQPAPVMIDRAPRVSARWPTDRSARSD